MRAALDSTGDWRRRTSRPGQYAIDLVADDAAVGVLEPAGLGVLSEESGLRSDHHALLAVLACAGLILAPVYMLRFFQGAMYGERALPEAAETGDMAGAELALLSPLVVLMFVIGLAPNLLVRTMTTLGQPVPWH